MASRTLTVRGVSDEVLRTLRRAADVNRRSLNGELLVILERAAALARDPSGRGAVREPTVAAYADREPGPAALAVDWAGHVDRDALARVCRRHHVAWLAVFGSHARGTARPDSDVDVVADFEPGMTPGLGIVAVAEALRPVFGDRRVDLVTRRGLSPRFLEHILATAVPLHGA